MCFVAHGVFAIPILGLFARCPKFKKKKPFSRFYYKLFTVFTKSMFGIGTLKFTMYAPFRRQWLHAVRQCLRLTSCSHIEKKIFWRIPMATCHPAGYLKAHVTQNKPRKILFQIQVLQQKKPSTSRWLFFFIPIYTC